MSHLLNIDERKSTQASKTIASDNRLPLLRYTYVYMRAIKKSPPRCQPDFFSEQVIERIYGQFVARSRQSKQHHRSHRACDVDGLTHCLYISDAFYDGIYIRKSQGAEFACDVRRGKRVY